MPRPFQRFSHRSSLVAALLVSATLLAGVAGPVGQARAATAAISPAKPARCADTGRGTGVLCTFSDGKSSVRVDQTTNLINQTVNVSWSGLPPTTDVSGDTSTNAVAVLQCWGANPVREHCWPFAQYLSGYTHFSASDDPEEVDPYKKWRSGAGGAGISPPFVTADRKTYGGGSQPSDPNFGLGVTLAPDYSLLPPNEVLGRTADNGSGGTAFEVRTNRELPSLGCAAGHPCSLVVIPVIHPLRDAGSYDEPGPWLGLQLSATNWNRRAVIPLTFAPQAAPCAVGGATALQVTSSEVAENALRRWQPGLCSASPGAAPVDAAVTVLDDLTTRASIGAATGADLAVVNRALPAAVPGGVTYAPLVGAGVVIAFNITNTETHRPFTELRLSPLLMAKLLTQSYCGLVCGDAAQYPGGDPNVRGNYGSITEDPELYALNPSFRSSDGLSLLSGASFPPEVAYNNSDVFYRLTRWIDADPVARAWLDGKPDGRMKVNRRFRKWLLPLEGPEKRDNYTLPKKLPDPDAQFAGYNYLDLTYQFTSSLRAASQNVLLGWSSAAIDVQTDPADQHKVTGFKRVSAESVAGQDTFILGIMGSGQAAAFGLPMASLPTVKGRFVAPDSAGLTAAMGSMTKDAKTGLWALPAKIGNPAAYPLTVVEHAVGRNHGLSAAAAAGASALVRYAASKGQVSGPDAGQLPAGYVKLTPAMATQALGAADVFAKAATTPTRKPPRAPKPPPAPNAQPAPKAPRAPAGVSNPTAPRPTTPAPPRSSTDGSGGATGTNSGGGATVPVAGSGSSVNGSGAGGAGTTGSGTTGSGTGGSGTTGSATGSSTGGSNARGSGTGGSGTTGSHAPGAAAPGTPPGGSNPGSPASTAPPVPGAAAGAAAPGVAVAGVAAAAPAAQPLRTADAPAGSLRWVLLALLVIGLAAGIAAPLLAGTRRGAEALGSVKKLFGR